MVIVVTSDTVVRCRHDQHQFQHFHSGVHRAIDDSRWWVTLGSCFVKKYARLLTDGILKDILVKELINCIGFYPDCNPYLFTFSGLSKSQSWSNYWSTKYSRRWK